MARIKWNGDKVLKTLGDVVEHALLLTGYDALRIAQEDVPVDTGTLRRSGTVTIGALPDPQEVYTLAQCGMEKPKHGKRLSFAKRSVFVSYSTPYAIYLHESPNRDAFQEFKKLTGIDNRRMWRGRLKPTAKWKWLERALPKAWAKFERNLRRAEKKAVWWLR